MSLVPRRDRQLGTDNSVTRDRRVSCPGWIDWQCPSGIDESRVSASKASKASNTSQHQLSKQGQMLGQELTHSAHCKSSITALSQHSQEQRHKLRHPAQAGPCSTNKPWIQSGTNGMLHKSSHWAKFHQVCQVGLRIPHRGQ